MFVKTCRSKGGRLSRLCKIQIIEFIRTMSNFQVNTQLLQQAMQLIQQRQQGALPNYTLTQSNQQSYRLPQQNFTVAPGNLDINSPHNRSDYLSQNQSEFTGNQRSHHHPYDRPQRISPPAPNPRGSYGVNYQAQYNFHERTLLQAPRRQNQQYTPGTSVGFSTSSDLYATRPKGRNLDSLTSRSRQYPISPPAVDVRSNIKDTIFGQLGEGERKSQITPPNTNPIASQGVKRTLDASGSPARKRAREDNVETDREKVYLRQLIELNEIKEGDKNSQIIWTYFVSKQQTEAMYNSKMTLRQALYEVLKGVFPYCGVYIVGSSMNGFGNNTSDCDMCLMLTKKEIDQKVEATELLRLVQKAFRKLSFIKELQLIKAKVPIIKFTDKISEVEVDLNVNNAAGIRNTHLLCAYSRMDWRVRPLVLWIKKWARHHDINDARKATISSYSLVLMVLHFLQYACDPIVLPCLQKLYPEKFQDEQDIRKISLNDDFPTFQSENKETLAELFLGFLKYYTEDFDYERDVVSVRLGSTLPKRVAMRGNVQISPPGSWKYLCVQEPFNLSNTSRSVYDQYQYQRITRVFRNSYQRFKHNKDLNEIMDRPL